VIRAGRNGSPVAACLVAAQKNAACGTIALHVVVLHFGRPLDPGAVPTTGSYLRSTALAPGSAA